MFARHVLSFFALILVMLVYLVSIVTLESRAFFQYKVVELTAFSAMRLASQPKKAAACL